MTVELTFFGGAGNQEQGELGGVQLLVNDPGLDTKFLYEFGQRPDMTNDFYGFPYRPQSYQALDIYEHLQLYAALPDIFRHDYELHRGKKIGQVPLDGMLLSHWHFDHNGGLPLLRHDLPIFMHPLHKQGMYVWQETSSTPSTRFLDVRNPFAYTKNNEGGHRYFTEQEASIGRDIRLFESEVPFTIGNIRITPYLVDHSLPGACGFILETSAGKIGISGDIRLRGYRRKDTEHFVDELLKQDVDFLLWEGSLLHFPHEGTEDDVVRIISELVNNRSFAGIGYAPRDFDRLLSLYKAAAATERILIISTAQEKYLRIFNGANGYPLPTDDNIAVYLPKKNKGMLDRTGVPPELVEQDYYLWERDYLSSKVNRVSLEQIANNPANFLVSMPPYAMINMLAEIQPQNGKYIRSHPGPWTKAMEVDEDRQIAVLKHFGLYEGEKNDMLLPDSVNMPRRITQVHVTGHLNRDETRDILGRFHKTTVIPYHNMNPQDFPTDVAKHLNVIIPEQGKPITLK